MSSTGRPLRSIATVCLSGGLGEKLEAATRVGFDGVEIFENDLLTFDGSPADVRRMCDGSRAGDHLLPAVPRLRGDARAQRARATSIAPSASST